VNVSYVNTVQQDATIQYYWILMIVVVKKVEFVMIMLGDYNIQGIKRLVAKVVSWFLPTLVAAEWLDDWRGVWGNYARGESVRAQGRLLVL
jgi:hypothetical protein